MADENGTPPSFARQWPWIAVGVVALAASVLIALEAWQRTEVTRAHRPPSFGDAAAPATVGARPGAPDAGPR